MTEEFQTVPLQKIYLDTANPRHDSLTNEKAIIEHLIGKEDIRPLAKDISEMGSTSPLELVALIPHSEVPGAFVAAEGNRRVCALKLLADPDKAPTERDKKYFRALSASMAVPIKEVRARIFPDRESARPWVARRHEGQQGGVGTKPWDPTQKTRFSMQRDGRTPNSLATLLLDYARSRKLIAEERIDRLSLTTLTRYLTNPEFRASLGLVDHRSLLINVPTDEFDRAVTRFLEDALDGDSGVSSRTTVAQRREYAERLRKEGAAPLTRGIPPHAPATPAIPELATPVVGSATDASRKRNNRSPDDRRTVVPATFKVRLSDKVQKRLYDELRTLDAEKFPFAAVYLMRAFIEQTAVLFLKQNGIAAPAELHAKLGKVADWLENNGTRKQTLKPLRVMANDRHSRQSADTLGAIVHGVIIPTKTDAIRVWDSIETVLTEIVKQLR